MKKGFTLIELLAVIVILAIIAVIAVPIVLNIIDDTKKNAGLRSADFYLDAVEMSIANSTLKGKNIKDGTYNIMSDGNICLSEYNKTTTSETCTDTDSVANNEILKIEVNGETPTSGTITIENGNIIGLNIEINEKEIYKNSKGELVYSKTLDEVCKPAKEQLYTTNPKESGYKYECKVDPNKDAYTFFVLKTPQLTDKSINLIMDRNINSDGTPVIKAIKKSEKDSNNGIYNLVPWISTEKYYEDVGGIIPDELKNDANNCQYGGYCGLNDKGPITAMDFLSEATKNWSNTNEMIVDSFDCYNTNLLLESENKMKKYSVYARMPNYTELNYYDSTNKTNAYLYDYLTQSGTIQTNITSGIKGYWINTSSPDAQRAWTLFNTGGLNFNHVSFDSDYGVRPVISLKI